MGEKVNRGRWDREGRENFRKEIGKKKEMRGGLDEELRGMGERTKRVIGRHREGTGRDRSGRVGGGGRRGWWDEECKEEKRKMRKELRKWKTKGGKGEEFRVNKKKYRRLCERKKKEERERIVKEAGEAKTEGKVWKLINKERRRRGRINEDIEMGEWKVYFMRLLGGVKKMVRRGRKSKREKKKRRRN